MDGFIVVSLCLALNAVLAAYEMAFVSISKSELRALARGGDKRAKSLLELRENPERTLSIIQIGITLVGALAAAVGGASATENIEPYFINQIGLSERVSEIASIMLIVVPLAYLSVVVGELVPKSLALRNPRKIVLGGSGTLFVADRILAPLVTLLEWSTKFILSIFFHKQKPEENLPQTSIEIDSFSPVHQHFMLNMAHIEKKTIKDIMLPWDQVNHVQNTDSVEEVAQVVLSSGHTRLPVKDSGHVIGVLHTKEFMALRESGEKNWQSIVRPVFAVKPTDFALGVLRLMQEKRNHMCIVFSPTGLRLGIVTIEDILEEIVGDIFDEDDDGRVRKIFVTRTKDKLIHPT